MNAINMGQTLSDMAPGSEINKSIAQWRVFSIKNVHDESEMLEKAGSVWIVSQCDTRPHDD